MTEKEQKEEIELKGKEESADSKVKKKPIAKQEPEKKSEAKEKKEPVKKEEPAKKKEPKKKEEPEEKKEPEKKKEPAKKTEPEAKPLDRMTAKELREMALGLEGIVGVHAMNKSELVAAIKEAKGIVDEKKRQTSADVRSIKRKIRELRSQKEATRVAGDKEKMKILRRRINRLKKQTRRATKLA